MIKDDNAPAAKLYSENAAAIWLGVSRRTIQQLPIPRLDIVLKNGRHKKRFVRYAEKDLLKFKEDHIVPPGGWGNTA